MMERSIKKSLEFTKRAKKVIPHITGTFSRSPTSFIEGVYPAYVRSGRGSYLIDVDGNEYLDYFCGLGPITLGYNYKRVNDAIIKQLKEGILFSLPHPTEVELAESLCDLIPNADMAKFEKSGSNAVTAAVRAARAYTKRDKIAYCGSGGVWHDWQAAMVSRDAGVPRFNDDLIKIFDYNDSEGLEQIYEDNKNEIAAIVLEPTHFEKPTSNFLNKVRKIASTNNSVLILDEIVTGFRFDLKGGQKFFDIKGDLVCFGKGMGNGLPISAITGPSEYMKTFDKLWVSSTNNSEALSLAGTIAVINEMKEKDTISHCWQLGKKLMDGWNKITESHNIDAKMRGYPVRMELVCNDRRHQNSFPLKCLLLQEMVKGGIFMSLMGAIFLSYSHSEKDIEKTLKVLDDVCKKINSEIKDDNYQKKIEGNLPQVIWEMKLQSIKHKKL